ncbi:5240_t:CDS:2 [Racocetra persica]|uniref:5240_t:CDS:1 n=1 Tax=Racocetra persica TaxID=160502 RepID=A0ACA9N149_9GLOM|nr:5240_t:CDS:2 [Racocetra persica]
MKNGEKRKARNIVYQAAQIIEKKTSLPFLTVFEGARTNAKPGLEMKSRRVGATKQRVPKEIDDERGEKIFLRWIVEGAKEKKTPYSMSEKLAEEIHNAYNKSGEAYKKKEVLYKEAESERQTVPLSKPLNKINNEYYNRITIEEEWGELKSEKKYVNPNAEIDKNDCQFVSMDILADFQRIFGEEEEKIKIIKRGFNN